MLPGGCESCSLLTSINDFFRESVSDEINVYDGQELCSTTFSTSPADGVCNGQINQHKQSDPIKITGQRSDNKEELQIQRYGQY